MLHRVARPWRERRLRGQLQGSPAGGCAGVGPPGDSWRLRNSWPPRGDSVYPWRPTADCDVGLGLGLGLGFWGGGAGRSSLVFLGKDNQSYLRSVA